MLPEPELAGARIGIPSSIPWAAEGMSGPPASVAPTKRVREAPDPRSPLSAPTAKPSGKQAATADAAAAPKAAAAKAAAKVAAAKAAVKAAATKAAAKKAAAKKAAARNAAAKAASKEEEEEEEDEEEQEEEEEEEEEQEEEQEEGEEGQCECRYTYAGCIRLLKVRPALPTTRP